MTVGTVGPADPPCPECGGDAFSCTCEPVRESFTADDLSAATESWRKRADTAVKANAGWRSLVDDLKAEIRDLRGAAPSSPVIVPRVADRPAPAPSGPVRPPETPRPDVPARPGNLGTYLANLVDPPRIAYALALAAHLLDGAPAPEAPTAPWVAKVDAKVRRLALVHVGR